MVITIADCADQAVARVTVNRGKVRLDGDFPGGLTAADLESLGFVYYETDPRGEMAARVKEVPVESSLRYLRALMDALPPGYHISRVQSELIDQERDRKRVRFEKELSLLGQEPEELTE